MRLRTFDGDIPLTAGSFLLKKAPQDSYQNLHKSWFKNAAVVSCASTVSFVAMIHAKQSLI